MKYSNSNLENISNLIISVISKQNKQAPITLPHNSIQAHGHDVASSFYLRQKELHGSIKVLGMSDPISVSDLFVHVSVSENISKNSVIGPSKADNSKRKTVPAVDVVQTQNRLVILGAPGSGKTTILKYINMSVLEGKFNKVQIPIYVPLHAITTGRGIDLSSYMMSELESVGIKDVENFVDYCADDGNFVFLFDGLDEVSQNHIGRVVDQIMDMSAKYSLCNFVISCRTAVYNNYFPSYKDVEVASFTPEEIDTFVKNWYRNDAEKASLFLDELKSENGIYELAKTPILLTMLCLAFRDSLSLSRNRAQIYKEAVDTLLKFWDATRLIKRDTVYKALTLKHKKELLEYLAASSFEDSKYHMKEGYLEFVLPPFLRNVPDVLEPEDPGTVLDIVKSIESHHGILTERAKAIYAFSHLTFQEYFTARYVTLSGDKRLKQMVDRYLFDLRWREVFVLCGCLLRFADTFLYQVIDKISRLGIGVEHARKLRNVINHAELQGGQLDKGERKTRLVSPSHKPVYENRGLRVIQGSKNVEDLDIDILMVKIRNLRPNYKILADFDIYNVFVRTLLYNSNLYNTLGYREARGDNDIRTMSTFKPPFDSEWFLNRYNFLTENQKRNVERAVTRTKGGLKNIRETKSKDKARLELQNAILLGFRSVAESGSDVGFLVGSRRFSDIYEKRVDVCKELSEVVLRHMVDIEPRTLALALKEIPIRLKFENNKRIYGELSDDDRPEVDLFIWMLNLLEKCFEIVQNAERDSNLCAGADVLGELLKSPISIDKVSREIAQQMLKAISTEFPNLPSGPAGKHARAAS